MTDHSLSKTNTPPKIIGGMFGLEHTSKLNNSTPCFLNDQAVLLLNASSGLSLLIKMLSPPQVWMPSYLCDSMLKAADNGTTAVRFYGVNYDLEVSSLDWIDNVVPNDLVVVVDYFGFPFDKRCADQAKKQGAWILKDACQAFLSQQLDPSFDFILLSPRKFIGIPDGGVLNLNHKIKFDSTTLERPPAAWWLKALSASILRREFDLYGGERVWFELFQDTETNFPIGPYAMSQLTQMMLRHSFDYPVIAQKRIENYQHLNSVMGSVALFPKLPDQVVPLGFPIRVKDRDRVRQALFDHEIYPPLHWPIHDIVPEKFSDSHRLAAEIMTLPCDQRYDLEDMEQIACSVWGALQR